MRNLLYLADLFALFLNSIYALQFQVTLPVWLMTPLYLVIALGGGFLGSWREKVVSLKWVVESVLRLFHHKGASTWFETGF